MELFEYLGGHYIPTGVAGSYKLCDFLYKEPFFGTMYAKQFPGNWSCPFPPVSIFCKTCVILMCCMFRTL